MEKAQGLYRNLRFLVTKAGFLLHWLFGAYHSAFENLSCKFVLSGFDGLWIRIYSQKIDIIERNRLIAWILIHHFESAILEMEIFWL